MPRSRRSGNHDKGKLSYIKQSEAERLLVSPLKITEMITFITEMVNGYFFHSNQQIMPKMDVCL